MKKDLKESITTKAMLKRLQDEVNAVGSQAMLGALWEVPPQHISNALTGFKLPSPAILRCLGLLPLKTINYRYKEVKK